MSLMAADLNQQILGEFRKTKADVEKIYVIAEQPLAVAVTGTDRRADWPRNELLGIFAHRGDQLVPVSILPNHDYPVFVWIDHQTGDSVTFALADPDYGVRSDNLK